MTSGIMQPYLFPYIGYFQLINIVDKFVVYDNIKYTKKGWINRNRILVNGKDEYITLPLKKDSDYLNVSDRYLSASQNEEKKKLLAKIKGSYSKAPFFSEVYPILQQIISFEESNLFCYIFNSIKVINGYLEIRTPLIISSSIPIDHELKSEEKVIAICKSLGSTSYINPIGGVELYSKENFKIAGISLNFLKSEPFQYTQFDHEFVPWLSIIDVMMFNGKDTIIDYLNKKYSFVN